MSRRISHVVFLTTIWVLLWGSLSVANVASGVLLSVLLMVLFPSGSGTPASDVDGPPTGRPRAQRGLVGSMIALLARVVGWAQLIGYVFLQLVVSNVHLTREILTRHSRIRTGIVACPLRVNSERSITFVANVLSLSPGTMPIEVGSDPAVIYVHVLHLDDPAHTRRVIAKLETLTLRAFGLTDHAMIRTDEPTEANG